MGVRLIKAIILGVLVGAAGFFFGLADPGIDLEEDIGLRTLFRLRGPRPAPTEVAVVSIDKDSSDALNVPNDLRKWPRSFHARLVERLSKAGASVVVFDLIFDEGRDSHDDLLFAAAVGQAGNVVLFQRLRSEKIDLSNKGDAPAGSLYVVQTVSPIAPLAESAVALAPFPLPKVPN
ncbi:MAG: CHASE2 domain-containing protein [Nitrospirota bacterium]